MMGHISFPLLNLCRIFRREITRMLLVAILALGRANFPREILKTNMIGIPHSLIRIVPWERGLDPT